MPHNLGKWTKNGPKTWFFGFIERFGNYFLLNLFYNENLHYLLCSCKNPIFGKIFVPDTWAKMFSAHQIAGFLINHISRTKQQNSLIFCMLIQVYINSNLIKNFLGGYGQKWAWPVWSWDSGIDCISRMNR